MVNEKHLKSEKVIFVGLLNQKMENIYTEKLCCLLYCLCLLMDRSLEWTQRMDAILIFQVTKNLEKSRNFFFFL